MAEPPTIPLAVPITAPLVNAPADLGISAPVKTPALAAGGDVKPDERYRAAMHTKLNPSDPVKVGSDVPGGGPLPPHAITPELPMSEAHAKGGAVGDTKPRYVGVIHKHG